MPTPNMQRKALSDEQLAREVAAQIATPSGRAVIGQTVLEPSNPNTGGIAAEAAKENLAITENISRQTTPSEVCTPRPARDCTPSIRKDDDTVRTPWRHGERARNERAAPIVVGEATDRQERSGFPLSSPRREVIPDDKNSLYAGNSGKNFECQSRKNLEMQTTRREAVVKRSPGNKHQFVFSQMTPELAYLIGAYLGDGSVSMAGAKNWNGHFFSLCSIDRAFVERVKQTVESILGKEMSKVSIAATPTKAGNPIYRFSFGSVMLGGWLVEVTQKKAIAPLSLIRGGGRECLIAFMEGMFDSEGFVALSKQKKTTKPRFTFGIACCSEWIHDVAKLAIELGVKQWNKCMKYRTKGGKDFYLYRTPMSQAVDCAFRFTAPRKANKVKHYLQLHHSPSTTLRESPAPAG